MQSVKYGRKKYTKREDEIIRTLLSFGYSNEKISQELINMSKCNEDINPRTTRAVQLRIRKLGLHSVNSKTKVWRPEDTDKLCDLLNEGIDIDTITHVMGFSDTTIRKHIRELKLNWNNPNTMPENTTQLIYNEPTVTIHEGTIDMKYPFTENPYLPEEKDSWKTTFEYKIISLFKRIIKKIRRV